MNILDMSHEEYKSLGLFEKEFRDYHWYERHHHINDKIMRCLENILREYKFSDIHVDGEGNLIIDIDKYVKDNNFDYNSYQIADIKRTLFILEDFIRQSWF